MKKGLRKVHRKTLVLVSLLNKVVGPDSATLLNERLWWRYFLVTFANIFTTPF